MLYKKVEKDQLKAFKKIENSLNEEDLTAINNIIVLAVNINLDLEDLLSDNYDPEFKEIISTLFGSDSLDRWQKIKEIAKEYITITHHLVILERIKQITNINLI